MFTRNCFNIWREEEEARKIITLFKMLDKSLRGGINLGLVTEICGATGVGKTQMCLQLCINVQFPKKVGGIEGSAIYIDTNQGFHPKRLQDIARCVAERFKIIFNKMPASAQITTIDVAPLLENVEYIYCADYKKLFATVKSLEQLLRFNAKVKLVIIDSYSYTLRQIEESSNRLRIDYEMLTQLLNLAKNFQVAVVITNDLTTCNVGSNWIVCPALGASHEHKINVTMVFTKDSYSENRMAVINKSVMSTQEIMTFQIKESGIRGSS